MRYLLAIVIFLAAPAQAAEPAQQSLYIKPCENADETLGNLKALVESGKFADAARTAGKLLSEDLPLYESGGVLVPFNEYVRLMILEWPEPAREEFRKIYEADAKLSLETALARRDLPKITAVAKKYPLTNAASAALDAIVEIKLQRGDFTSAITCLDELIKYSEGDRREQLRQKKTEVSQKLVHAESPLPARANAEVRQLKASWSYKIAGADVDEHMAKDFAERKLSPPVIMSAATAGDTIFFSTRNCLAAVSAATGNKKWSYPEKPESASRLYLHGSIAEPAAAGKYIYSFIADKIVALDPETGKEAWSTSLITARDEAAALRGFLVNSLAASADYVLVAYAEVRQETLFSAAALDARTGKILWRRTLCSQLFTGWIGRGVQPAPPVIHEDTGYVVTNLGMIAALDLETGAVKWGARYPSFDPPARARAFREGAHFENSRPAVCGNLLIAAPTDSGDVIALDIATGKKVWGAARKGMKYLAGVCDGKVLLAGAGAMALDTADGKIVWQAKETFSATARPAIFSGRMFVPLTDSVAVIDATTGDTVLAPAKNIPASNLAESGDALFGISADTLTRIEFLRDAPAPPPEKRAENIPLSDAAALRQIWHLPLDPAHKFLRLAFADDKGGRLYFSTADVTRSDTVDYAIECRARQDGRLLWRQYIDAPHFDVRLEQDVLLVRNSAGVLALDPQTGESICKIDLPGNATAPDCLTESGMYITGTKAGVAAIDIAKRKLAWSIDIADSASPLGSHNGRVFVAGEKAGDITVIDAAAGKVLSQTKIIADDTSVTANAAVQPATGRIALAVGGRSVHNFSIESGGLIWKKELGFAIAKIIAEDKHIFVFPDRFSFGNAVTCLDAETGKVLSETEPIARDCSEALIAGGVMTGVKSKKEKLLAVSLADNKVLWSQKLGENFDRVMGGGEYVVVAKKDFVEDEWLSSVRIFSKDGKYLREIKFPGASRVKAEASGRILLLFTERDTFAYDMLSDAVAARNLESARADKNTAPSALAGLLANANRPSEAYELLQSYLTQEPKSAQETYNCAERLASLREAAALNSPLTYLVPRAKFHPVMDGQLSDDLRIDRSAMLTRPVNIQRIHRRDTPAVIWGGAKDLSAIFYLAWDNKNLYIIVDVTDDVITPHNFQDEKWNGDCLVVATAPEGGYHLKPADNIMWFALSANPKENDNKDPVKGEYHVKVKPDGTGLVYEMALPLAYFKMTPKPGSALKLNIAIVDDDGKGAHKAATWTPGLWIHSKKHAIGENFASIMFGTITLEK